MKGFFYNVAILCAQVIQDNKCQRLPSPWKLCLWRRLCSLNSSSWCLLLSVHEAHTHKCKGYKQSSCNYILLKISEMMLRNTGKIKNCLHRVWFLVWGEYCVSPTPISLAIWTNSLLSLLVWSCESPSLWLEMYIPVFFFIFNLNTAQL